VRAPQLAACFISSQRSYVRDGARNGHAEVSWRCPLLGEQRKTYARMEYFRFGPILLQKSVEGFREQ
ncbi:MAG: hypothetical protein WCF80_19770, partial [Pseudolabrys sp.]